MYAIFDFANVRFYLCGNITLVAMLLSSSVVVDVLVIDDVVDHNIIGMNCAIQSPSRTQRQVKKSKYSLTDFERGLIRGENFIRKTMKNNSTKPLNQSHSSNTRRMSPPSKSLKQLEIINNEKTPAELLVSIIIFSLLYIL